MKKIFKLIGPGIVTASVVLGPGSVTVATKSGSLFGYSMLWWLVVLWAFMVCYTAMSAKIGILSQASIMETVATRFGRIFSAILGLSVFFICCSFQTGDVIGVSASITALFPLPETAAKLVFPVLCIIMYYFSPNIYIYIERIMLVMVITMIVAFFSNLVLAKPDMASLAAGFIPAKPKPESIGLMTAMAATNFVVAAAMYQSYLVKEKGWKRENYRECIRDTLTGISILFILVAIITITSAAVLKPRGINVQSAADMAIQLEPLLGIFAKYMFCAGLFAASFSSLAVNALVGATLLSDGIGKGYAMNSSYVKAFSTAIMLFGVIIAMLFGGAPVASIILVQKLTLLTVPLLALALVWAANSRQVVGEAKNPWWQNVIALLGFVVLLWLFSNVAKQLLMGKIA